MPELASTPTAAGAALMTVRDVAAFLQMSTRYVYKLEASGELLCVRFGAAVRFRPEDVRTYVERQARPPATVTSINGRETMSTRED